MFIHLSLSNDFSLLFRQKGASLFLWLLAKCSGLCNQSLQVFWFFLHFLKIPQRWDPEMCHLWEKSIPFVSSYIPECWPSIWVLVKGWKQSLGIGGVQRMGDGRREKLAGRFWKAVTFPMMSAFPITALTPDPGRWFNGGILFLLTSPFPPLLKQKTQELGLELCGKSGQAAKIYHSSASSPVSLCHWFTHCVGLPERSLRFTLFIPQPLYWLLFFIRFTPTSTPYISAITLDINPGPLWVSCRLLLSFFLNLWKKIQCLLGVTRLQFGLHCRGHKYVLKLVPSLLEPPAGKFKKLWFHCGLWVRAVERPVLVLLSSSL